jgi:hypothetical protein
VRTWFEGYRNLKNSSNPLLHGRAERMKGYVRSALPGLYPAILFGPNADRRNEAREFLKDIEKELGPVSAKERLFGWATLPFSADHRINGQF